MNQSHTSCLVINIALCTVISWRWGQFKKYHTCNEDSSKCTRLLLLLSALWVSFSTEYTGDGHIKCSFYFVNCEVCGQTGQIQWAKLVSSTQNEVLLKLHFLSIGHKSVNNIIIAFNYTTYTLFIDKSGLFRLISSVYFLNCPHNITMKCILAYII